MGKLKNRCVRCGDKYDPERLYNGYYCKDCRVE